jgi:hypothetical protein
VNLDEWAWHIIDNIRAEDARNPSAELRELAAELVDLVPPRPTTNHLGFAVPLRLRTGAEARSVPPRRRSHRPGTGRDRLAPSHQRGNLST